jgi:cytochrome c biogenesis protein CcdA
VAIVGLLTAQTTFVQGLGYLGLYNLMFVMPLLVTLAFVGNRKTIFHIRRVERSGHRWMHLASGLSMIGVGALILIVFV